MTDAAASAHDRAWERSGFIAPLPSAAPVSPEQPSCRPKPKHATIGADLVRRDVPHERTATQKETIMSEPLLRLNDSSHSCRGRGCRPFASARDGPGAGQIRHRTGFDGANAVVRPRFAGDLVREYV